MKKGLKAPDPAALLSNQDYRMIYDDVMAHPGTQSGDIGRRLKIAPPTSGWLTYRLHRMVAAGVLVDASETEDARIRRYEAV